MRLFRLACVSGVLLAGSLRGEDAVPEQVQEALGRATSAEFRSLPHDRFAGTLTEGLEACDGIDVEVAVRDGGTVDIVLYPRMVGERLDSRRSTDRAGLVAKLGATDIAPLAWDLESTIRGSCVIHWGDTAPAQIEKALHAATSIDKALKESLPALRPALTRDEVTARLREAAGASEAKRNEILAGIVAYLPELTPATAPGGAAFEKVAMNGRGAAFDAFRFRVPANVDERRLVWAFAYPPGTAKGWYIAPVGGDAQKFVKFHKGGTYAGLPDGYATLLQRSETPLRAGGEYVMWFQFKVETPVDMYIALACVPFAKSDRDAPGVIEEGLGLKPER